MIQKQSASIRDRREALTTGGRTGPATAYPARLLLIEDHPALAEATAELLRRAGLEVRIAKSGEGALQMAITFRPDIVVCDMMLPDMSGIEIGRRLRQNPGTRDALIVMHTAMSESELRIFERDVKTADFNLFLTKPMTEEKIERLWVALAALRKSDQ
jgi:CheY-like chemotaxis protein